MTKFRLTAIQVSILLSIALVPMTSVRASPPTDASQLSYQTLIQSMRYQELLEQQAATKLKQLQHQVAAARALAELNQLGGGATSQAANDGELPVIDLSRSWLQQFQQSEGRWSAQLRYEQDEFQVNDRLPSWRGVQVQPSEHGLVLTQHQQQRVLMLK